MKIKYALLITLLLSLFVIVANTFAHRLIFRLEYVNPYVNEWTACDIEGANFGAGFDFYFTSPANYIQDISVSSYNAFGAYLGTNWLTTTGWMPAGAYTENNAFYRVDFGLFGMQVPHLHGFPGWVASTYVVTETYTFTSEADRMDVLGYQISVTCDIYTGTSTHVEQTIIYAPFWYN